MPKPQIILDTSPLITLCSFRVNNQRVVEYLLDLASVFVVDTVAKEATANPGYADSAVVAQLLETRRITKLAIPMTAFDQTIDGYTKLGQGERHTIRLSLMMPEASLVLDDYLAFVIASRFGLKPVLLLDLIVSFVEKARAIEIVEQLAPRYSAPFVSHTLYKLEQPKP